MKKSLYNIYKVIRSIIVVGILTILSLYIFLYILVSIPSVQNKIKEIGETELTKLLHAKVSMETISINPFNQVIANNVKVYNQDGINPAVSIKKLGAGISLYNLFIERRLVFTFAEIIGLDGKLYKETPRSPLNIQFIIDALSKKKPNSPPTKFDVKIYNIVIRKSMLSYDVLSEQHNPNKFDKNHISLSNITGDIVLPRLKNNDFVVNIKRLAFDEKSGLVLKNLSLNSIITNKEITVSNFYLELPNTIITPEDITLKYNNLATLGKEIKNLPLEINISNSYVTLRDFSAFVPALYSFDQKMNITMAVRGTMESLYFPVLNITTLNKRISIDVSGTLYNISDKRRFSCHLPHINIEASAQEISKIMSKLTNITPKVKDIITACGNVHVDGTLHASPVDIKFTGRTLTSIGNISMNASLDNDTIYHRQKVKGRVATDNFNLGTLINKPNIFGAISFNLDVNGLKDKNGLHGKVNAAINYADIKNYRYNNINANLEADRNSYMGEVSMKDENIDFNVNGSLLLDGKGTKVNVNLDVPKLKLAALNLLKKYPDKQLSFSCLADFVGNDINNVVGNLSLDNINFVNASGEGITLTHLGLSANQEANKKSIILNSDIINGKIEGLYNFNTLVPSIKRLISKALPSLFPNTQTVSNIPDINTFDYSFTLEPDEKILPFFNLPIRLIHPVTINGSVNTANNKCNLIVDAPYLQQKDKLIENSSLNVELDGNSDIYQIDLKTLYPNKKGNIALTAQINAANDMIDTGVSWWMDRKRNFSGRIDLSTLLSRNETNKLDAKVSINPTELVFNDTVWNVKPSTIFYSNNNVDIEMFEVRCANQYIRINGRASNNPNDQMIVDLEDINLNYLFETLEISNVTFGGQATGRFYASNLFTKIPTLATPNLHVKGMTYNDALLGDTDIESHWDPSSKGIAINADINQKNGRTSLIRGAIYPTMDSLYLDFKTDKLPVGFLQPFMSAFTSKVSGYCSGNGTLYGNFKRINFKGDLYAEDLKMLIDYINVTYTCTDSVHIRPDNISLDGITLRDPSGHTAELSGSIRHQAFHNAIFDISIKNARNFLCYDITPSINPDWYGTIYGNGSAYIKGEPGVVNIGVNMATADNSKFTFVMSDTEAAGDYNFITFFDRNKLVEVETDSLPDPIKRLKAKKVEEANRPTQVNITLQVEATPQAQLTLVMDPVGGDRIKTRGSGNLRLAYNSVDGDLNMLGKYTLDKGFYNFTLQDIIIKDFTIKEGSSITFNGDPMAAILDISAIYSLNANLTDLDESFALDKEMNRTNVPVHAVLKASGDISEPTISFDLEFPTLTQEAYRKIRSIISTEDMMNRQIIYLVALNRFYTPEYMGRASNNNEFANVASSTISSQLSSMLGQISDNWTIAPNFRTNKGDFSDVEVDLALSSQLLNNRLLLNGNFGYRDKALNSNSSNFIGDFDIEYLLTKNGSLRLKAYNRYNDQNYYIKSALTTQGVGIVLKHDFDRIFDFLKPIKKKSFFLFQNDSTRTHTPKRSRIVLDSLETPNN